ncbi:MAG: hypothetical protein CMK59_10955 [Proteobacteria bacterium]|nr:hypothetical protein [Pseudomonadota bacterium]
MRLFLPILLIGCSSDYDLSPKIEENPPEELEELETLEEVEASAPVAVCDVSPNPVNPPFESATFTGVDSYDPDGGTITKYQWELISVPEGAAASFSQTDQAVVSNFMPDVAGDYVAELTVTNEAGLTGSCETTLQAIPAQNLWVEMYWQYSGDDMDLHLIAPNYDWQSNWNSTYDCYYGNCVNGWLDWGQIGYGEDDPALDLDDIPGVGPENINVYEPEINGTYTVVLHDYPGSVYEGANDVTINIYLDGTLAWSDTRTISGEDSCTPFAQIDWGAGVVIPLNQGSTTCPASSWF